MRAKCRSSAASPFSLQKVNERIKVSRPARSRQLLKVVERVGDGDQTTSRLQDARQFTQAAVEVGYVEEHPRRQGHVELVVAERQLLYVAYTSVDSVRALDLDHSLGLLDPDQFASELR